MSEGLDALAPGAQNAAEVGIKLAQYAATLPAKFFAGGGVNLDGFVSVGIMWEDGVDIKPVEGMLPSWEGVKTTQNQYVETFDVNIYPKGGFKSATIPPQGDIAPYIIHHPQSSVIAKIDKLISEEKCWHCGRDRHRGRLTQKILTMYEQGRTDPYYFAQEDRSRVVCEGSEFIGPIRPKNGLGWDTTERSIEVIIGDSAKKASDAMGKFLSSMESVLKSFEPFLGITVNPWLPGYIINPQTNFWVPPTVHCPTDDLIVEFGPDNWKYEFHHVPGQYPPMDMVKYQARTDIAKVWDDFFPPPIVPDKPGYDFTHLDTLMPKKYPSTKGLTA